jgi:hypothetical protein
MVDEGHAILRRTRSDCVLRALHGQTVLRESGLDTRLVEGDMLYRIGKHRRRDTGCIDRAIVHFAHAPPTVRGRRPTTGAVISRTRIAAIWAMTDAPSVTAPGGMGASIEDSLNTRVSRQTHGSLDGRGRAPSFLPGWFRLGRMIIAGGNDIGSPHVDTRRNTGQGIRPQTLDT